MRAELSVVIPVHRNAASLRELRERIVAACGGRLAQIVFVDDACPQGSLSALRQLAEADDRVMVVALADNVGQHRAVLAGLAYATGRWVAIMDADLQDPPEVLPLLLDRASEGWAAVFAGRRGLYESRGRLISSRLFKWTLHALTGLPADAGIFCMLNREAVERVLAMNRDRPSVVAMIGCTGLPVTSVPVVRAARPPAFGPSAYGTWKRVRSAWQAMAFLLRWKLGRLVPRAQHHAAVPIKAVYGRQLES